MAAIVAGTAAVLIGGLALGTASANAGTTTNSTGQAVVSQKTVKVAAAGNAAQAVTCTITAFAPQGTAANFSLRGEFRCTGAVAEFHLDIWSGYLYTDGHENLNWEGSKVFTNVTSGGYTAFQSVNTGVGTRVRTSAQGYQCAGAGLCGGVGKAFSPYVSFG
jgi:hypothetical protein